MNICGLVVAGGTSRRMGDENKLWLELGGEALVQRAARRLGAQVDQVIINANEALGLEQYITIADAIEGGQGPLSGILSGLEYVQEYMPHITHIASVPADAPFSPNDLVRRMRDVGAASDIIIPFVDGFSQQLFALWPVSYAAALREFMMSGENRKVMSFVRSQEWRKLLLPDDFSDQFINVNNPEDWAIAQEMFDGGKFE